MGRFIQIHLPPLKRAKVLIVKERTWACHAPFSHHVDFVTLTPLLSWLTMLRVLALSDSILCRNCAKKVCTAANLDPASIVWLFLLQVQRLPQHSAWRRFYSSESVRIVWLIILVVMQLLCVCVAGCVQDQKHWYFCSYWFWQDHPHGEDLVLYWQDRINAWGGNC
jgi:hypothetical protein